MFVGLILCYDVGVLYDLVLFVMISFCFLVGVVVGGFVMWLVLDVVLWGVVLLFVGVFVEIV